SGHSSVSHIMFLSDLRSCGEPSNDPIASIKSMTIVSIYCDSSSLAKHQRLGKSLPNGSGEYLSHETRVVLPFPVQSLPVGRLRSQGSKRRPEERQVRSEPPHLQRSPSSQMDIREPLNGALMAAR